MDIRKHLESYSLDEEKIIKKNSEALARTGGSKKMYAEITPAYIRAVVMPAPEEVMAASAHACNVISFSHTQTLCFPPAPSLPIGNGSLFSGIQAERPHRQTGPSDYVNDKQVRHDVDAFTKEVLTHA